LRVFCLVMEQPQVNRYRLQCEYGILDRLFPARELIRVPELAGQFISSIAKRKKSDR
jgi:hypothetical protein